MRPETDRGRSSVPWDVTYLSVAALSFGLLVGVWHAPTAFRRSYGLVVLGLVVGAFAVTSLLHWCDVTECTGCRR